MSLVDLVDNSKTDKNTSHSYLPLYEKLFSHKRDSATHVLEIGIGPQEGMNGGSIKLWRDYFTVADIHTVDIIPMNLVYPLIQNDPRIHLHTEKNAYDNSFVSSTFGDNNIKFDILIDDGPHTLDSMKSFIQLYAKYMKDDGILVIEDIQDIKWIPTLKFVTPLGLKEYIEIYDLRKNKGRYDDIVFVINKSKKY
jgi:hypothetical protein